MKIWNLNKRLQKLQPKLVVLNHSSITSAKKWVGGVRKYKQFLLIYSTIYADVGGWA